MGTTLLVVFLLAWGYSCFVYLYLAGPLARYRCPPLTDGVTAKIGVSVVVCARNERRNLEALLPLLLQQRYDPYEIVIADDASDDGTAEFLQDQRRRHTCLRVVRIEPRPTHVQPKKHALTQAIQVASYDRLLLTDADCRPASAEWLAMMTAPLQASTQFVLGYSPYQPRPGGLNTWIRYETLHTGFLYTAAALAGRPYMGVGRNLAYRKLFFQNNGGFRGHETVVGGDDDLWVNRWTTGGNTVVVLRREALVYSVPKACWSGYLRQKMRHLHVGQYYRPEDKAWLGLLSLSAVVIWTIGVFLLFVCKNWGGIVTLFVLRWFILAAVLNIARRRLHDPINLWLVPILDFLHVIYYGVVGILAFSTKHIRWTN